MNLFAVLGAFLSHLLRPLVSNCSTPTQSQWLACKRRRLKREDVLRMIEKRGSPVGLDLSGRDLSCIDLSGVNLHWVNFSRARLFHANLSEAFLEHANFTEARCWRANMTRAGLWAADFRAAGLNECDLHEAFLRGARLQEASMLDANLERADLRDAVFSETRLSRKSLGEMLVQESESRYRNYLHKLEERLIPFRGAALTEEQIQQHVELRYRAARDIYRSLKNNFIQIGWYDEASWAYFREQQAERKTFHPGRARRHYSHELPDDCSTRSWRWWAFYLKYTARWMTAWVSELSCGYGERPLYAVFWAVVIVLVFPFMYWLSAGVVNTSGYPMRWFDYLQYSLASFSTIGFPDLIPVNDVAKLLTSLEALLGISVLALLMFALACLRQCDLSPGVQKRQ